FDNQNQLEGEKAFEILNRFAEVGGNFIDTSNNYSYGKSEEIVGNWLSSQKRDRFVIATKCGVPSDMTNVNSGGLSRKNIVQTVEGSLKRLQTDYVDLLQTHIWDVATPIEETLRTLDDLVRSGKVRYIGCSNVCGWQLQKILCLSKSLGLTDFVSLQQQYNLLTRSSELEEIQVCRNEGLGLIPFSALKNGLLTGKYKRDKTPEASQGRVGFMLGSGSFMLDSWSTYSNDEKFWNIQDKLTSIAGKHSKTVAQVSLRWLLQKEIVPSVIIGVTSLKQLEENVEAAIGWELTEGEVGNYKGNQ
ncbi:hypothetical protein FSP39_002247, partial [Pinctada imbricata]